MYTLFCSMNYIKNYNSPYIARIQNRLGVIFKDLFVNIFRKVILLLFVCVREYIFMCVFMCAYVCVWCTKYVQVTVKTRRVYEIAWSCSYRLLWVTQHACWVPDSGPLVNGIQVTDQPSWPPTTNFLKWRTLDFSPVLYTELHHSHNIINFLVLFLIFWVCPIWEPFFKFACTFISCSSNPLLSPYKEFGFVNYTFH